jgi:uncharacterized membrane protein
MTFRANRRSARFWFGMLTLVSILILLILVVLAPPDGKERAQWLHFFGDFHPIAVHLPIAILVLVPLIELAGRSRFFPQLLSAVDFLLGVAICSAIVAVSLGWCLARSDSYSGSLVKQHMWGGILVALAAWLCWLLRARGAEPHLNRKYAVVLLVTVGLVSFTGYRGGQLSQGENHLTEHMPDSLRRLLGVEAFADIPSTSLYGGPTTFYGARIQPIFSQHCVGCHGQSKHKANLRLDTYEAVMRGSKDGRVVKGGNVPGSELFRRITLPPTNDDFMPAEHKPPLSPNEIKRIELWISSGASGTQPTTALKDTTGDSATSAPVAEVTFEAVDPAAVVKQRTAVTPIVAKLQQRFSSALDYQSRGSADLVMDASLLGPKFGDDELAALAPISGQIVFADFSGTAITDGSCTVIASMKRLRSLRLAHTKITDNAVKALASLDQLESLNLFDTPITPDALPAIGQLPKLQHFYVRQTKISPETAMPDELKKKIVF